MHELAIAEGRSLTATEIKAQVQLIQQVMKAVMKKDVHYGTIPGTPKPTLYKPGAEKILSTFRIAAGEPVIEDLSTPDEIRYRVKVPGLTQSIPPILLGVGVGECSSSEEKYRWRRPVCKEEWEETAEDRRRDVWKKFEGKSTKLKQVRTTPSDVANTVLKMAHKRGFIGMTLVVTAASDVFAQDLEDLPTEIREAVVGEEAKTVAQPQRVSDANGESEVTIHEKLWALCLNLAEGNEPTAHDILEKASTWKKDDGSVVKGKQNVNNLSKNWAASTYGKLKKDKATAHA